MTKSSKKFIVILLATLLCLALMLVACEKPIVYQVTFGSEQAKAVEKDGSITAPDYTVNDPLKTFLGWASVEGKTSATDVVFAKGATISYEQLSGYAVEDQVKFYPVISTKKTIALTIKGATDKTATLIEGDSTSVQAPEVTVGEKQEFLGWANEQNATTAQIAKDGIINYASAQALATNGALTLYPVYKTYDLVVGIVNIKFKLEDAEGEIIHDVNYYVDLVKADFAALYPDVDVLYRIYNGNATECGAAITADGDVDVVLAGNNIDKSVEDGGGAVEIVCKNHLIDKYNPDGARRGALITLNELAIDMYAMVIGSENVAIEVTIDGIGKLMNKAIGNSYDVSNITDPSGRVLVGFARTENATTPEIVGTKIDYSAVEEFATDGAITLYPVWGEFDLIVAVWGQNGTSNTYATAEQIAQIEADFRVYLAANGIENAIMRFDRVEGKTAEYPANIATDVMVILSGKNVESQTGATGKYECINITVESTRYAGVFTERVSADQQAIVDLFIKFVAEAKVEVTLGETKTVVSSIDKNTVDISAIEIPTGKKIAGFATTAEATEAQIVGTKLDYAAVSALATDGKVTLYPVFEELPAVQPDLVFDVLFKNITQEELDTLIAGFKAWLKANGDNTEYNIVVRTDFTGTGANFLSRVASTGDVDVVLGASNLVTQSGNEIMVKEGDGAYGQALAIPGSSRCVGMIAGCANSELAIKFVQFCQTAPQA